MSNLLEKASILLTPTAYDDGKILSVKPEDGTGDFDFTRNSSATRVNSQGLIEDMQILSSNLVSNGDFSQEGAEEVTNGDFATDSDWVKQNGWSIANNTAIFSGTLSAYRKLYQENILTIGKIYKLTFDIVSINSGSIKNFSQSSPTNYSTIGTKTEYFTATFDDLFLEPTTDANLSIDNVSVKEVGQDWTFTSGATLTALGAKITHTPTAGSIAQLSVLTLGKKYKLTYEITESISGGLKFNSAVNPSMVTTVGVHTKYFEADGTTAVIGRTSATDNDVTITNISVIEITDDTNLPRINYTNFDYEDVLGDELVTNGNFDTDSDWIKQSSWSIANGSANCDGSGGFRSISQSALTNQVGKTYKISYEVSNYVSGEVRFILGGLNLGQIISANGVHTETIQAVNPSTNSFIYIETRGSGFIGSIDNVSVKELTEDVVVPYSGEGSLLLEPQSTNLLTYSEDFSQWSTNDLTLESGYLAPDGSTNAYKVTKTGGGAYVVLSGVSASDNARTIYAKTVSGSGDVQLTSHNLNTNNLFTVTEKWQRFEINSAPQIGTNFYAIDFRGVGTTLDEVIIWGAQTEALSYATSYIPTEGSIKTRLQDAAFGAGSSDLINSTEGVLYAEIAALSEVYVARRFITLNDGGSSNTITLRYEANGIITARYQIGGVAQCSISFAATITNTHKIAFKYKQNDFALWVDGTEVGTDTTGNTLNADTINKISFDSGNSTFPFYGKTKCVAVFKEALTDEELTCLTTI